MTVYRRPRSPFWQIEFSRDGRRVRVSSGTANRREAEALERRLRQQDPVSPSSAIGPDPSPTVTLGTALDRYACATAPHRRSKRARQREAQFLRLLGEQIGRETPLADLTAARIAAYREDRIRAGRSPATVDRYLAILRAVLRMAHFEWEVLTDVPRITLHRSTSHRVRWLTEDEEQRLLRAVAPHLRPLLVFLIDTGARLSEATGLRWSEVDLEPGNAAVRFERTKTGRPRRVPLTRRVRDELAEIQSTTAGASQDRVFLFDNGDGPRPYSRPYGAWNTALARAGITDLRIHDLRHTFASRLVMRGVPLAAVSQLLGHSSLEMTMRYAHLAPSAFAAAIGVLDDAATRSHAPDVEPAGDRPAADTSA